MLTKYAGPGGMRVRFQHRARNPAKAWELPLAEQKVSAGHWQARRAAWASLPARVPEVHLSGKNNNIDDVGDDSLLAFRTGHRLDTRDCLRRPYSGKRRSRSRAWGQRPDTFLWYTSEMGSCIVAPSVFIAQPPTSAAVDTQKMRDAKVLQLLAAAARNRRAQNEEEQDVKVLLGSTNRCSHTGPQKLNGDLPVQMQAVPSADKKVDTMDVVEDSNAPINSRHAQKIEGRRERSGT